jgi:hypothetical protein
MFEMIITDGGIQLTIQSGCNLVQGKGKENGRLDLMRMQPIHYTLYSGYTFSPPGYSKSQLYKLASRAWMKLSNSVLKLLLVCLL